MLILKVFVFTSSFWDKISRPSWNFWYFLSGPSCQRAGPLPPDCPPPGCWCLLGVQHFLPNQQLFLASPRSSLTDPQEKPWCEHPERGGSLNDALAHNPLEPNFFLPWRLAPEIIPPPHVQRPPHPPRSEDIFSEGCPNLGPDAKH